MSGIVSRLNGDVQETNVSMLHWRWRAESTMPLRCQNQMPACEVSRYRVSLSRSFSRSVAGRLIMYLRRCATSQSITPTKADGATGATSSASSISTWARRFIAAKSSRQTWVRFPSSAPRKSGRKPCNFNGFRLF